MQVHNKQGAVAHAVGRLKKQPALVRLEMVRAIRLGVKWDPPTLIRGSCSAASRPQLCREPRCEHDEQNEAGGSKEPHWVPNGAALVRLRVLQVIPRYFWWAVEEVCGGEGSQRLLHVRMDRLVERIHADRLPDILQDHVLIRIH